MWAGKQKKVGVVAIQKFSLPILRFGDFHRRIGKQVKLAHEPDGPHCRSLCSFQYHEVTRSIATPLNGMLFHRSLAQLTWVSDTQPNFHGASKKRGLG